MLGVRGETVSRWERGVYFPDYITLEKIAKIFKWKVWQLFHDDPVRASERIILQTEAEYQKQQADIGRNIEEEPLFSMDDDLEEMTRIDQPMRTATPKPAFKDQRKSQQRAS